jgi:threonine/homoserine/homoserine lactone efflux protein
MSFTLWLTLAGVCLAGAVSPGPSLAVVVNATLRRGKAAALAVAWGHALGVALYALLTILGVAALITAVPALFKAIQLAGATYLIYLAIGMLTSSRATTNRDSADQGGRSRGLADGFSIAFFNPKLAVFMLALFSQFVRPDFGSQDLALMVATAGMIDGLWYSVVVLLLSGSPGADALRGHSAQIDRIFALLLFALAGYIIVEVLA